MFGTNFPISEYYKTNILDAETVTRGRGGWWTAVLLIRDPKTEKPFIGLYRWQLTESGWKTRKRFSIRRSKELNSIIEVMQRFSRKIEI